MAWTSGVTTKITSTNATFMPNPPTNIAAGGLTGSAGYYTNIPIPPGQSGQQFPTYQIVTPQQPAEGMLVNLNGKLYRYSEAKNEWHEVVDAPTTDLTEVPTLPVELDASAMLDALKSYRDFLEELEGDLDERLSRIVDDTLFGLGEAIKALELLG